MKFCKRAITSKRYDQQTLINKSLEFSHSKTPRQHPFLVAVFSCIFSSSFFLKFLMLIFHLNIFMLGIDSMAKCRFLIIIRKFGSCDLGLPNVVICVTQSAFTSSKLTIEKIEQDVKYIQS